MSLQFVVKDENGDELVIIDAVEGLEGYSGRTECNLPLDPRYTYELRELADD